MSGDGSRCSPPALSCRGSRPGATPAPSYIAPEHTFKDKLMWAPEDTVTRSTLIVQLYQPTLNLNGGQPGW